MFDVILTHAHIYSHICISHSARRYFQVKYFCCLQITFFLRNCSFLFLARKPYLLRDGKYTQIAFIRFILRETFFRTKDDVDVQGCIITMYITSPVIRSIHDFGYRITFVKNQSHKVTTVFYFIYCCGSLPGHIFQNLSCDSETYWVLYFKHTQSVRVHHKTLLETQYRTHLQIPRGFRSLFAENINQY